jgi:hypothetical protein
MTVSSYTLWKLKEAAERLATGSGNPLQRAQLARLALTGIDPAEFVDDAAGVLWRYIESIEKAIHQGSADVSQVNKFNSSIWGLFTAFR